MHSHYLTKIQLCLLVLGIWCIYHSQANTSQTNNSASTTTAAQKTTPKSGNEATITTAVPRKICSENWKESNMFGEEEDIKTWQTADCQNLQINDENVESYLKALNPRTSILNLHGNFLTRFDFSMVSRLTALKAILLSDNKLSSVSSSLKDLPKTITLLDFSNNKLTSVGPEMVPESIVRLYLSNNAIKSIVSGTFKADGVGKRLTRLDLSHNRMNTVFDTEDGELVTPKLQYLNLSHNSLGSFFNNEQKKFRTFQWLQNLLEFDLSFNGIDRIFAADLQHLGKLKSLDLSHNYLPDMDAFSFNALTLKKYGHPYLWQHWKYQWWILPGPGLKSIQKLNISNNFIHQIDVQLINHFALLGSVDLSNNRYVCNGELYLATEVMKKHTYVNTTFVGIKEPKKYTCFAPKNLTGQHIYKFNCSGDCRDTYDKLTKMFDKNQGYPIEEKEDLTGPNVAMIVATCIFCIISFIGFLWALRNGLIHRCCHVCLTRLSTAPRSRSNNNNMTARFAQLDQLEADTEVA